MKRLSNRADFLAALTSDFARLASGGSPLRKAEIKRLGYYMPRSFNGTVFGGLHPSEQSARPNSGLRPKATIPIKSPAPIPRPSM